MQYRITFTCIGFERHEYTLHPVFNELFHFLMGSSPGVLPLGVRRYQENDTDLTLLTVSLSTCTNSMASKIVKILKDILIWEELGSDRQTLEKLIENHEKTEFLLSRCLGRW